jgi:hypothetical protein
MNREITCDYLTSLADIEKMTLPTEEAVGSYALVKDGNIEVHHPPEGPYPMVVPCPGVKLIVNGRECTKPIPVSMEDTLQLETVNELRKGKWSVTVSPDGLQAILQTSPTVLLSRELQDLPPARVLKLAVVEHEKPRPPLTVNELLQELSIKCIKYGIDWEACSNGVKSCDENKIVIATGIPAKPGKDGQVELLFTSDPKVPIVAEEDETVDFRKRYIFTSVDAGEILAVRHLPKPGYSGTSVSGDIIVPPKPCDCILCAGEGAVLTKDGKRAVAARPGRPTVSRRRDWVKVSVVNELVHSGDIDLSSGNIVFKGDILILGNVTDGMLAESCQNIRIKGLVSGARVQATGSISVGGNILSSVITAGNVPDFQKRVLPQIHILADGLHKMVMAIRQLLARLDLKKDIERGIGPLVKLLLEGKFFYLIDTAKTLNEQIGTEIKEMASGSLEEFIRNVERVIVRSPLTVSNLSEIETLAQQARQLEQTFEYHPSTESHVVASSIQNSTIIATGDVQVVGSGCYISRIQAGKKVSISGVVRGGTIQADSDVYVGELGSKGGATAKVVAGPTAVVKVGHAYENSVVLVGGKSHRFNREQKNVRLWLDEEDKLRFDRV